MHRLDQLGIIFRLVTAYLKTVHHDGNQQLLTEVSPWIRTIKEQRERERERLTRQSVERGTSVLAVWLVQAKKDGGVGNFQEFVQEDHSITPSRAKLVGVKGAHGWISKSLQFNRIKYLVRT